MPRVRRLRRCGAASASLCSEQAPLATKDTHPDVLSSGAGLAAAVAVESGTQLGEFEPVRARGYWEQVWLRFRRDRFAIAGGVFIVLLFIVAFAGSPIAAHFL